IDMLDFADFVAINKFDRKGAEDALRDVRKQYQRNRSLFDQSPDSMPVYGTMASRFNDDGVTALYQAIVPKLREQGLELRAARSLFETAGKSSTDFAELITAKAAELTPASAKLLEQWPKTRELYA